MNRAWKSNGTPPLAIFDASHGQRHWAQTGFPTREMHTNFSRLTEALCRRGFRCQPTRGESLTGCLTEARLLIVPSPTGRYDSHRERWQVERSAHFTRDELDTILNFLRAGGRLLAFAYRFGDSFTQTNLGDLCAPLGCRLNDDAVIDIRALRQTDPLHLHFETPAESLSAPWVRIAVRTVHWRPAATFSIAPGATARPLALSTGGACLSFDRTLRQISFESRPLAVAGGHGAGRFALFGGPHVFESGSLGLLVCGDNTRFLHNVLDWLVCAEPNEAVTERPFITCKETWGDDLTRIEAQGNGELVVARVERLLRKTGVLKALSRAKWMP